MFDEFGIKMYILNIKLVTSILLFLVTAIVATRTRVSIQNITVPEDGNLESPQWSADEQALYWVNSPNQMLFRRDGETGNITSRFVCFGKTPFIVPVRDHPGYVVVAVRSSIYLLKWGAPNGDAALRLLTTVDRGLPDNNINDAKADAVGRLWFGTLGKMKLNPSLRNIVVPDQGTLYSLDFNNFADPVVKKRPVSLSNGIAFSLDNTKMYYNDSPTRKVVAFDYDLETGFIANEAVIFDFDNFNIPGFPDGLTRDAQGNLWVATFTELVLVINPDNGKLLRKLELPVDHVSSVMWGGKYFDSLFVTTSGLTETNPKPLSGSMLEVTNLGTKGVLENQFVFPNAITY